MTRSLSLLWPALLLLGCRPAPIEEPAQAPTVAKVQTTALARRDLSEDLVLFGLVVPGPKARHTASVPFEARVTDVHVREGQRVETGDPLVDVEPSAEAQLSLERARTDAAAAAGTLHSVTARFRSQLATQIEMATAERDAREAEQRVHSLVARGADRPLTLRAVGPSVVTAIRVARRALVPPGATLVDLDLREHLEVLFGVEVEDLRYLSVGREMRVTDLALPPRSSVGAVLRAIGESVNPATRLVDCYASLPTDPGLLLGQRVVGHLEIRTPGVFVVPRAALVPEPDRMVIYTVGEDGSATSQEVRVGLENDRDVEIISSQLREGMRVVVAGASVLQDGMRVSEATP